MRLRELVTTAALAWLWSSRAAAALVDPAFTESFVTTGVNDITGIDWAPDGSERLFFLRKSGEVRIIDHGVTLPTPFATVAPIQTTSECGLLGIAFDPDFIRNGFVYLFATVSDTEQQIIRYTANGNVGEDKTVIVGGLPTLGQNHDGGALGFGPDGKLYWAIGDNGNRTGVQKDLTSLASKVGRANRDGSALEDNPFFDGAGPHNDYIWATGFRNPFTLSFQPATGRLWLNVVGANYEQIFMPRAGDNGGWNLNEANQPAGFLEPVISYTTNKTSERPITTGGAARKGGISTFTTSEPHRFQIGAKVTVGNVDEASFNGTAFVRSVSSPTVFSITQAGPDVVGGGGLVTSEMIGGCVTGGAFWDSSAVPTTHRGDFFFTEYTFGRILRATLDAGNRVTSVEEWGNGLSRVVDMAVGPDGDMYYARLSGNVYRASYTFAKQALIVSRSNLRIAEGGFAAFNVRLALAPASSQTVRVEHQSGDGDVQIEQGDTLEFSSEDWSVPQRVLVRAELDVDALEDAAVLEVSSAGLADEAVAVRVTDADEPSLFVSPSILQIEEGASAVFEVSLREPPASPQEVTVALLEKQADLGFSQGLPLVFTADDWATPQLVEVIAESDDDDKDDHATLLISSSGFDTVELPIAVADDDRAMGGGGEGAGGEATAPAAAGQGPVEQGEGGARPSSGGADAGGERPFGEAGAPEPPVSGSERGCGCAVGRRSDWGWTAGVGFALWLARRRGRSTLR